MEFTEKQRARIKSACVIAVLTAVFIADKHNIIGACIAIPTAIVMAYIMFTEKIPCCNCRNCGCSCHKKEG